MTRKLLLETLRVTPVGMSFDIKASDVATVDLNLNDVPFRPEILRVTPIVHAVDIDTEEIETNMQFGWQDVPTAGFAEFLTGPNENDWPQVWAKLNADFPVLEEARANAAKENERQNRLERRRASAAAKKTAADKKVTPIRRKK